VTDGDLDRQQFVSLYVKNDKVVAVLACEREAQTARLIDAMRDGVSRAQAMAIVGGAPCASE
jgi:hypothetical protein